MRRTRSLAALLLLAALAPGIGAQDAAPQPAADYARLEQLVRELRETPPDQRAALLDRLYQESGAFLDAHMEQATPAQLALAATTWLQLARRAGDEQALRERLERLEREAARLPATLRRQLRLQRGELAVRPGEVAPVWSALDVRGGGSLLSSELRGKLALLHFWSPRHPAARGFVERKLAPLVARWQGDPRLAVVALAELEGEPDLRAGLLRAARSHGVTWRLALDPDGGFALDHGASTHPYLCLIDPEGKVLAVGHGWRVIDEIERLLSERLSKPAAAPSTAPPKLPPEGPPPREG